MDSFSTLPKHRGFTFFKSPLYSVHISSKECKTIFLHFFTGPFPLPALLEEYPMSYSSLDLQHLAQKYPIQSIYPVNAEINKNHKKPSIGHSLENTVLEIFEY